MGNTNDSKEKTKARYKKSKQYIEINQDIEEKNKKDDKKDMNCTPKVGHKTTFGGAVFL